MNTIILSGLVLNFFVILAFAENHESLSNERFPLDAKLLEKHWHVDCTAATTHTQRWLSRHNDKVDETHWATLMWRDLKLCAMIYNSSVKGDGGVRVADERYKACPNFRKVVELLIEMKNKDCSSAIAFRNQPDRNQGVEVDRKIILRDLSTDCRQ